MTLHHLIGDIAHVLRSHNHEFQHAQEVIRSSTSFTAAEVTAAVFFMNFFKASIDRLFTGELAHFTSNVTVKFMLRKYTHFFNEVKTSLPLDVQPRRKKRRFQ